MKSQAKNYAVITCDIVGSRQIEEFRRKRDQKLHHVSRLHVEKKWINQPASTLEFIVDEKPTRAGIDPFNKLIDRNPEDNTVDVTKQ